MAANHLPLLLFFITDLQFALNLHIVCPTNNHTNKQENVAINSNAFSRAFFFDGSVINAIKPVK